MWTDFRNSRANGNGDPDENLDVQDSCLPIEKKLIPNQSVLALTARTWALQDCMSLISRRNRPTKNGFYELRNSIILNNAAERVGSLSALFASFTPVSTYAGGGRCQNHLQSARSHSGPFLRCFGFSLDAIKNWESRRRQPEAAARVLLTVVEKDPAAVVTPKLSRSHRRRK